MVALFPITSLKYFKTIHSKFFFSKTSQFNKKEKEKKLRLPCYTDCYEHNLVCNLNCLYV